MSIGTEENLGVLVPVESQRDFLDYIIDLAPYILPIESHFNVEPLVQFLVVEFRELHITQYPLRVRHHEIHLAKVQIGNELGVRCIAASIKHGEQKPQYAFSISAPIHRMDEKRMKEIAEYALAMKKINL